jgi:L-rhamnose-H+ transport protein
MAPALVSILGALVVLTGGLLSGSAVWPMKLMKRYQFEHWWFVAMLTGLIVVPWSVTLVSCPNALRAFNSVPWKTLVTANLWAIGWGVANVLCGLCYVRLGIALTSVIVTGLGAATGVTMPLLVKGSGLFQHASDLWSRAGITLLCGAGVMLFGVALAGFAGAGRERVRPTIETSSTTFFTSLVMAVIAGILSAGMGLSFVYAQGPIMHAMKKEGAGEIPSIFSVWAVVLLGGGLVSVLYPVWLMLKNRSWKVLGQSWKELLLALIIGANACLAVVLLGTGMRMIGPLGASVGLGVQTGSWMLGGQLVGFASGEWRGIDERPRKRIYLAILCLIAGMMIVVFGSLVGTAS